MATATTGSDDDNSSDSLVYANRHIPAFLSLPLVDTNSSSAIQIISDGSTMTASTFRNGKLDLNRPLLVTDTPESIGMQVPSPKLGKSAVSVRDIADVVGHSFPVTVMDVELQEELDGWILGDLVDYFEDEERILSFSRNLEVKEEYESSAKGGRSRRKAAMGFLRQTRHRVLNQISLEFSKTALSRKVLSPKFVRDMDWIDIAWPSHWREKRTYPSVQYYCLTSAAGCYTDFHVDFGGTSVWYHVLSGSKVFCLIPPTKENLRVYEEWLDRKDQSDIFLPDLLSETSGVVKVSLQKDHTMIVPSGWIHSVYTPEDSLVLGGNFLHGLGVKLQLIVNDIETRTQVPERFQFPYFVPLQFSAGGLYLRKLRCGIVAQREVDELPALHHALEQWWKVHSGASETSEAPSISGAALHAAESNRCASVEDFLSAFGEELVRIHKEGICPSKTTATLYSKDSLHEKRILHSPGTPRLRLKMGSQEKQAKPRADGFRISVSSSSRFIDPLPPNIRTKQREDVASYIQEDDEWKPRNEPKTRRPRSEAPSPATRVQKKAKTTARQRLLKKAR